MLRRWKYVPYTSAGGERDGQTSCVTAVGIPFACVSRSIGGHCDSVVTHVLVVETSVAFSRMATYREPPSLMTREIVQPVLWTIAFISSSDTNK